MTYVLIPGAGGDGWQWHLVVRELERRGHAAIPITLPAGDEDAGWQEYADAVVDAVGGGRDLVLVAQSLAGFTAPLVCERLPVTLLVLLNAMIPVPGETGSDWWNNTGSGAAMRENLAFLGLPADAAADDKVVYFHDVPAALVEEAYARGEPKQSMTPMGQPFPLRAWPKVPTRVLAGGDDRLFPLAFQRRVARERLHLDVDELPGGHMLALSRPRELTDRLVAYLSTIGM